jgi:preflagellin peptidase FlaK
VLSEKGIINDEVWVTPGLPFMIPITLGFFVTVVYGDMITELTKYLILIR